MKANAWILALALAGATTQVHADARADVLAAFEAAMQKKSYRVSSTTEVRGAPYETTVDVQLPGSFHMRNADTEAVILPAGTWMKMGGQWMKVPMDMSKMTQSLTMDAMKNASSSLQNVVEEGSETIDGCEARNYRYAASGEALGFKSTANVQLSICSDTGLPIRVISEDTKGKSRAVMHYDYDTPINIRPPN